RARSGMWAGWAGGEGARRVQPWPQVRSTSPVEWLRRRRLAILGWAGRGEEVDEQLVDTFSFVVMHPMRRVGQAFHAVEVGHVVAVGLGEFGAEVGIALPPDDQSRRRDRAKLCCGFLLGLPNRGAVVVDYPGCCPGCDHAST